MTRYALPSYVAHLLSVCHLLSSFTTFHDVLNNHTGILGFILKHWFTVLDISKSDLCINCYVGSSIFFFTRCLTYQPKSYYYPSSDRHRNQPSPQIHASFPLLLRHLFEISCHGPTRSWKRSPDGQIYNGMVPNGYFLDGSFFFYVQTSVDGDDECIPYGRHPNS